VVKARRPIINYDKISSSSSPPSSSSSSSKLCPIHSVRLVYRSDKDEFICTECGFTLAANSEEEEQQKVPDSPMLKNEEKEEQEAFIIPVTKSRGQEQAERMKPRFPGFESLSEQVYNLVKVDEHVDDSGSYNSSEMAGSFTNTTTKKRVYYK
jgi:hypothetical protein